MDKVYIAQKVLQLTTVIKELCDEITEKDNIISEFDGDITKLYNENKELKNKLADKQTNDYTGRLKLSKDFDTRCGEIKRLVSLDKHDLLLKLVESAELVD